MVTDSSLCNLSYSVHFRGISFFGNLFSHQIVCIPAGMGFSSLSFSPISAVTLTLAMYRLGTLPLVPSVSHSQTTPPSSGRYPQNSSASSRHGFRHSRTTTPCSQGRSRPHGPRSTDLSCRGVAMIQHATRDSTCLLPRVSRSRSSSHSTSCQRTIMYSTRNTHLGSRVANGSHAHWTVTGPLTAVKPQVVSG